MTDDKRFTIKSQDDYFGITDNNVEDKMNVINGIHTEIEAKWLCDLLNALHEENQQIKSTIKEAYENERTQIGKNVLKQLLETIQ